MSQRQKARKVEEALYISLEGNNYAENKVIALRNDDGSDNPCFVGHSDWNYCYLHNVELVTDKHRFTAPNIKGKLKYVETVNIDGHKVVALMKTNGGKTVEVDMDDLVPAGVSDKDTKTYGDMLDELLQEQTEALVKKNERIAEIDEMIETLKEEKANLKNERKLNKKLIQGYEELLDNEQA